MERLSEEQLWSWVDRDAAEIVDYLQAYPDERDRVESLRDSMRGLVAPQLPEMVGGYRIFGLLGEGAMGTVLRAEQPNPKRAVALKLLRGGSTTNRFLQLFRREAAALGRLTHPGIATIFEAGQTDRGEHFIAMELCRGVPLDRFVRERNPDRSARLGLFLGIADAIAHAHEHGVVHRDLKPSNILVDDDLASKVVDFGLADLTGHEDEQTRPGVVVGTLRYMSPEQAVGAPAHSDARSDVYSLGVILYELLAGCSPYDTAGATLEAQLRGLREREPRSLRGVVSAVPRDLDTIVMHCLQKQPSDRYATAGALADDLRRYLEGESIRARPPHPLRAAGLFVKRRRAGLSIGLSLLLVVATVALWIANPGPKPMDVLRATAGSGFATLSPFAAVRWDGERPRVSIEGDWWELRAIDGLAIDTVVRFCKVTSGRQFWSKRFEEDLVEVLTRVSGRDPGRRVTLQLRELSGNRRTLRRSVPMTDENRRGLRHARLRLPWSAVRWHRSRPRVEVDGRWFRLLTVQGKSTGDVLDYCASVSREDWRLAFELGLMHALIEIGRPAEDEVACGLVDVATGESSERRLACTTSNYGRVSRVWIGEWERTERLELTAFEQRAPFVALRWDDLDPEILVDDTWLELERIDGRSVEELLVFCRKQFPKEWRRRFAEDLVAVHSLRFGTPLGDEVELDVIDRKGGRSRVRVTATEEKRELLRAEMSRWDRP